MFILSFQNALCHSWTVFVAPKDTLNACFCLLERFLNVILTFFAWTLFECNSNATLHQHSFHSGEIFFLIPPVSQVFLKNGLIITSLEACQVDICIICVYIMCHIKINQPVKQQVCNWKCLRQRLAMSQRTAMIAGEVAEKTRGRFDWRLFPSVPLHSNRLFFRERNVPSIRPKQPCYLIQNRHVLYVS